MIDIGLGIAFVLGSLGAVGIGFMFVRGVLRKWDRPATLASAEAQELRRTVSELAAEVAELHERVDFTERMLASRQEVPRLEGRP